MYTQSREMRMMFSLYRTSKLINSIQFKLGSSIVLCKQSIILEGSVTSCPKGIEHVPFSIFCRENCFNIGAVYVLIVPRRAFILKLLNGFSLESFYIRIIGLLLRTLTSLLVSCGIQFVNKYYLHYRSYTLT